MENSLSQSLDQSSVHAPDSPDPFEPPEADLTPRTTPEHIDPGWCPSEDVPRLGGQNAVVLAALRKGPMLNTELAKIALKYTSRISDVRAYLKHSGETVVRSKISRGVNEYSIGRLAQ